MQERGGDPTCFSSSKTSSLSLSLFFGANRSNLQGSRPHLPGPEVWDQSSPLAYYLCVWVCPQLQFPMHVWIRSRLEAPELTRQKGKDVACSDETSTESFFCTMIANANVVAG